MANVEYTDTVIEHFGNPRNVGVIKDPDGIGKVGNSTSGDLMEFHIKVQNDRIVDVKFRTFGCAAAIASGSIASELIKGKALEDVERITNEEVAQALGGLPEQKLHCSNMAADALHAAILDYRERNGRQN